MNPYEALYILVPELDEETNKAAIEKFKGIVEANGGEIVGVDEWGKRRLAYPIDYKTEGYYILMSFDSAPELPAGLNLLHESHLGRVFTIIFRGNTQQIIERLAALDPVYMEAVPLTLEEIFIYELGGADYAVRDIVL